MTTGVAEILKVYVARELRGRGIATDLFGRVLEDIRAAGGQALTLWSDVKFFDGHRFYERQRLHAWPGLRAIHDASETLEINFRMDHVAAGGPS